MSSGAEPRKAQRYGFRVSRIGGRVLAATIGLVAASAAGAITILKAFPGDPADGRHPYASLVGDGAGNLYGTTREGGALDAGTVFRVKRDGSGFAVLHSFTATGSEGAAPLASLLLDGAGNLYGTTTSAGSSGGGTVFKLKTDGSGFAILHSFTGASDGACPYAGLVLDDARNLYGTTSCYGASDMGTVFKVKTDGTSFAVLHRFAGGASDGASPSGPLVLDGAGNLYGTTYGGGASANGAAFALETDGSGFAVLHSFTGASDGGGPSGSLALDGAGNVYGTAQSGGAWNGGVVFRVKVDGTGFAVLHSFGGGAPGGANPWAGVISGGAGNLYGRTLFSNPPGTKTIFTVRTDGTGFAVLHSFALTSVAGYYDDGGLTLDGAGDLYGATTWGGASDDGTVFTIKTDGTGYGVLHDFAWAPPDGAYPRASLVRDEAGSLYGTTSWGGASNMGVIYTLKPDGTGFSVLHSFTGGASDAGGPAGYLALDGAGNLYGTTVGGGALANGTVFTLKTDGSGFAVLYSFSGGVSDGGGPNGPLILDGAGYLYGTTQNGGASGAGTVFKIGTGGTGFVVLHSFAGGASDGRYPNAPLALDAAGNLYGTASSDGASHAGTIFTIKTDGTGFAILHSFGGGPSDGAYPNTGLILDGAGNLYGTTAGGGSWNSGTVFRLKADGISLSVLYSFTYPWSPSASLILDDAGNLYGTAVSTRSFPGGGEVFKVRTDGSGFAELHYFAGGAFDGLDPEASLLVDGAGRLYGTTVRGGAANLGTIFALPVTGDLPRIPRRHLGHSH